MKQRVSVTRQVLWIDDPDDGFDEPQRYAPEFKQPSDLLEMLAHVLGPIHGVKFAYVSHSATPTLTLAMGDETYWVLSADGHPGPEAKPIP